MGMKHWQVVRRSSVQTVSVLNREPMGMKHPAAATLRAERLRFSAQPRADGDEAGSRCPE